MILTKIYILLTSAFTQKEVGGDTLSFFYRKRIFQCYVSEILRVVSLLGEKFIFLKSPGAIEVSRVFKLSVYIHVVLPVQFSRAI